MNDDTKLKLIFYFIVLFSIVAVVGVWESFIEPLVGFLINTIHIN